MNEPRSANSPAVPADTLTQYREVTDGCADLFVRKARDYGTSWRVLRPISIVDQIYIKAWRIRMIQEQKLQRIPDSIASEFTGIVNYGIIALIQYKLGYDTQEELGAEEARACYEHERADVEALMLAKNHDYGEAWRELSQQSFVDLILVKLLRLKQIIANNGQTIASEGAEANFADIINYAVFALIKEGE